MRISVVEDEIECRNTLTEFLRRFANENGLDFSISEYNNGVDFLESFNGYEDLVFLDIKMPLMDGMETAKRLRQVDANVALIFVTSLAQYAIKGYEVGAIDFMVKPLSYMNFTVKMRHALKTCSRNKAKLAVKCDDGLLKVLDVEDIVYLEVTNNILKYHIVGNEVLISRNALKKIESELYSSADFARCNNCYLVNLHRVQGVYKNTVIMDGGTELAISRPRKKDFMDALTKALWRN